MPKVESDKHNRENEKGNEDGYHFVREGLGTTTVARSADQMVTLGIGERTNIAPSQT